MGLGEGNGGGVRRWCPDFRSPQHPWEFSALCCPSLQFLPKHGELEIKRGRQCKEGVSVQGGIELVMAWALRYVGTDVKEVYRTLITKESADAKQTQVQKVGRPQDTCFWVAKDEINSVRIGENNRERPTRAITHQYPEHENRALNRSLTGVTVDLMLTVLPSETVLLWKYFCLAGMGWQLISVISVFLMKWAEVKGYKNLCYIGLSLLVLSRHRSLCWLYTASPSSDRKGIIISLIWTCIFYRKKLVCHPVK